MLLTGSLRREFSLRRWRRCRSHGREVLVVLYPRLWRPPIGHQSMICLSRLQAQCTRWRDVGDRRRRPRILKAAFVILRKSRTGRRGYHADHGRVGARTPRRTGRRRRSLVVAPRAALGRIGQPGVVKLFPHATIITGDVVLVRFHNIDHHLGILFLFVFGDSAVGQDPLPVGWEALEKISLLIGGPATPNLP